MQQKKLSLAISAVLFTTFVQAQDNATAVKPEQAALDTVTVEAVYAVPAEHDNTGSSVTVLTEKDFQARNATYVIDVLKTLPSVAVGALGGRGAATSLFLRGADSDQTLVVIDGVKSNPATGGNFDFGTLPLSGIERIEVLRGEQSALWGSDAVGGVIHIKTKSGKNADKPFNADINIGGGSNKTADVSTTLSGRQGGLYYAINAAHSRSDGISSLSEKRFTYQSRDGLTITTGGAKEKDGFKRSNVGLHVGYAFENAGIELFAGHSSNTVYFDPSSLSDEASSNPNTQNDENTFKLNGYLGDYDDFIRQSAYISLLDSDSETQSQYPSHNKGKRLDVGYQFDVNFDQEGDTTQAVTGLLTYRKDSLQTNNFSEEKSIKEKSVALEYRLFNENDHALSLGVRYDDNSQFENALTYRLAGGYRFNDNVRLHGSMGTGIKNPTMYDYFGYYGSYTANPDLKPEKSQGGDIGLLFENDTGSQQLDVTVFSRNTSDLITTNSSYTQSINIDGKTRAKGIEISYQGQFGEALTAYANYTYTDTKKADGSALPRRPKHQANIGVNYQISDQLSTHANAVFVGKRLNNYFDSVTYQSFGVDMPSYEVFNVGSVYQLNKNASVYFNIDNIFDKQYENVIGYGQPGRTFYLGFKGSW